MLSALKAYLSRVVGSLDRIEAQGQTLEALVQTTRELGEKLDRVAENTAKPPPKPSVWLDTPPNSNVALFKALSDRALAQTVQIVADEMPQAVLFQTMKEFHQYALARAPKEGAILEFGVYSGKTINRFAEWRPDATIIGFDSFAGLPEEWDGWQSFDFDRQGTPPEVRENVRLEIGLFSETLPRVAEDIGPVAFLHVDCDIYASTVDIFTHLGDSLPPGCVIVFDEYFCYPGFEMHERRAFTEFLQRSGRTPEWFAVCGQRAACFLR